MNQLEALAEPVTLVGSANEALAQPVTLVGSASEALAEPVTLVGSANEALAEGALSSCVHPDPVQLVPAAVGIWGKFFIRADYGRKNSDQCLFCDNPLRKPIVSTFFKVFTACTHTHKLIIK